ncbi:hypothetical protein SB2_17810 [Methylobacterium radiotolerans]|nr:hypothetical protein SB3_16175 [Methylobacterium radiotolerans]KTS46344.1 hypothetical protein SB2_17810 [Methylobacterium radiotolerans]
MSLAPKPIQHSQKPEARSGASNSADVSPRSKELVIGVVGFAGAGCSTAVKRLRNLLHTANYDVKVVKLSTLIANRYGNELIPMVSDDENEGRSKFARVTALQNLGDRLRKDFGHHAVASLAVREILRLREDAPVGERKIAILLDSIKHSEEVMLLRRVYDQSFRLVAVHCEHANREARLIGDLTSSRKYNGVAPADVLAYMERDEKDRDREHGQQVRDAFYLADFFIDNNANSSGGEHLNDDLIRFRDLLLGTGLVRPNVHERAIFHAHAAAMQSACLSRQVGAALVKDGTVVATGTNDPPRFGGGVYEEDHRPEGRCFAWEWRNGELTFCGCHNQRKKIALREDIAKWMAKRLSPGLAAAIHPVPGEGADDAAEARATVEEAVRNFFAEGSELMEGMPGVKDIIEYSRSIHAEMNALFSAARQGVSPVGATLYCTTYPCHNCARHMVTAGINSVQYIEPYVKSLAMELHYDAMATVLPGVDAQGKPLPQTHMTVLPFTGVGPRMYEDFFVKRKEMKKGDGTFDPPKGGVPDFAVRLLDLSAVEVNAAELVPEASDA